MARLTDIVISIISSFTLAALFCSVGLVYSRMKQPVSQEPKAKKHYVIVSMYVKNKRWTRADWLADRLGIEPDSFYKWNDLKEKEWIKPGENLLIKKERITRKEAAEKYGL